MPSLVPLWVIPFPLKLGGKERADMKSSLKAGRKTDGERAEANMPCFLSGGVMEYLFGVAQQNRSRNSRTVFQRAYQKQEHRALVNAPIVIHLSGPVG